MKSFKKLLKDGKVVTLLIFLIPSLLLNIYFLYTSNQKTGLTSEKKQVTRVIDGDTFDVEGDIRVRLAGADAPEYPQGCLSEQAKKRLEELINGKFVRLEPQTTDNFGREVAYVFVMDLFIDQTLIDEGLARYSSVNDSPYQPLLLASEDNAKAAGRGIWSGKCTKSSDQNCLIKGNSDPKFGTKIYHLPDCYNYRKIVVNEKDGDHWFCSEEEAKKAGFRVSSDCPE